METAGSGRSSDPHEAFGPVSETIFPELFYTKTVQTKNSRSYTFPYYDGAYDPGHAGKAFSHP